MDPRMMAAFSQGKNNMMGGASQFLSGFFGDSGAPFEDYGKEYLKYSRQGEDVQNPFYKAGTNAIPAYQDWTNSQKDPSAFINSLMSKYQQSPWAKFQMQQGQNAANNAASASGMLGSTPFMQASQDYAQNISSQDMGKWLENVLGINRQYGEGQNQLMQGGQHSADMISQIKQLLAQNMGEAAYGKTAGENFDTSNMISGGLKFLFG